MEQRLKKREKIRFSNNLIKISEETFCMTFIRVGNVKKTLSSIYFQEYVNSLSINSESIKSQEPTRQRPELLRIILISCTEDIVEIKL